MKRKFLFTLILQIMVFCYNPYTNAQNTTQVEQSFTEYKGIVKDGKTNKRLVFADIGIKETNISTISNNDGEFLIKVPDYLENPILSVSHLGYKDKLVTLTELKNRKNIVIKLETQITTLSEINIHTIKDAKSLVKTTLSKKGENYLNEQTLMTAFYRETIKKRNTNASLSEAVVEIYKQPYTSVKNDKINLIKARKKVNYSKLDTLAVKLQGGPFSALYTDLIKYQEFIFTENDLDDYEFNFESIVKINNRDIYVIGFKQNPKVDIPLYYGKLYIDTESFALTSAIYSLNVENRELASKMYIRKKPRNAKVHPTKASYRVDYRVKNGLWYYGYSNVALTFKVNWKNKLFNNVYTLNSEMAVTNWKKHILVDKPTNLLRPTVILSEKASGFSDPNFWGEYNIIEPEKSIESAIKKINKQLNKIKS